MLEIAEMKLETEIEVIKIAEETVVEADSELVEVAEAASEEPSLGLENVPAPVLVAESVPEILPPDETPEVEAEVQVVPSLPAMPPVSELHSEGLPPGYVFEKEFDRLTVADLKRLSGLDANQIRAALEIPFQLVQSKTIGAASEIAKLSSEEILARFHALGMTFKTLSDAVLEKKRAQVNPSPTEMTMGLYRSAIKNDAAAIRDALSLNLKSYKEANPTVRIESKHYRFDLSLAPKIRHWEEPYPAPLDYAAYLGHREAAEALLVDPDITRWDLRYAAAIAREQGHFSLATFLEFAGNGRDA